MRRAQRRLLNMFAFSLLAFAIYLNFFYKDEQPGLLHSKPVLKQSPNSSTTTTAKPNPAQKK